MFGSTNMQKQSALYYWFHDTVEVMWLWWLILCQLDWATGPDTWSNTILFNATQLLKNIYLSIKNIYLLKKKPLSWVLLRGCFWLRLTLKPVDRVKLLALSNVGEPHPISWRTEQNPEADSPWVRKNSSCLMTFRLELHQLYVLYWNYNVGSSVLRLLDSVSLSLSLSLSAHTHTFSHMHNHKAYSQVSPRNSNIMAKFSLQEFNKPYFLQYVH